jgi:hypothetical protein
MSSSEKFCLRWNDFESNISVAFRELREEKDFFDITLAVDDSQIQAHKVILSACSPFFRELSQNYQMFPVYSVVYPDPVGSETFGRIRIRIRKKSFLNIRHTTKKLLLKILPLQA